ncbi:hypothetical protein [Methylobacterium sp. PvR107]|uniref:hypothetical protein n=1 Tax=Methylobacterium sp. PvR107 TaxID=2806597 RepID=UPI001AE843A6|nr:hypothetical protein [Methylobacterium sp. PvR107]MBP1184188.1 hypothetical protein [Methylobacterium sp. PvR107]
MTAEEFWAQPKDALPAWMIARRHYIESLNLRLGPGGTMRLVELIGEAGGLTPPEAEPWFEAEADTWQRIERILFAILDDRRSFGVALPAHLDRWIAARDARSTSLFDRDEGVHQGRRVRAPHLHYAREKYDFFTPVVLG